MGAARQGGCAGGRHRTPAPPAHRLAGRRVAGRSPGQPAAGHPAQPPESARAAVAVGTAGPGRQVRPGILRAPAPRHPSAAAPVAVCPPGLRGGQFPGPVHGRCAVCGRCLPSAVSADWPAPVAYRFRLAPGATDGRHHRRGHWQRPAPARPDASRVARPGGLRADAAVVRTDHRSLALAAAGTAGPVRRTAAAGPGTGADVSHHHRGGAACVAGPAPGHCHGGTRHAAQPGRRRRRSLAGSPAHPFDETGAGCGQPPGGTRRCRHRRAGPRAAGHLRLRGAVGSGGVGCLPMAAGAQSRSA